ncbi:MAG: signal recognition particle-docking protein FtsY [Acidimicrobiaceae bacterium]|nr:signal recognition particle-docking protein FtsY [Acidimicrobiaceae bacterium]MDE0607355.1 signal recognition particle-docking protein FtsY [Acidimicrobiaceae bacterium]
MFLVVIVAVAALILIGFSWYFLARDRRLERRDPSEVEAPDQESVVVAPSAETAGPAPTFRDRLGTARSALGGYLGSVFGRGAISEQTWNDLEDALIRADVGVSTAAGIISVVRARAADEGFDDASELADLVKAEIVSRLDGFDRSLSLDVATAQGEPTPAVWLFVGVNGVGKTTTIGKLAQRQSLAGRSVVLAAGDTFRAAAVEQLAVWSERSHVEIVRGSKGADPSSVVFDAIEHAAARSVPLVMADTAGRLQTKTNLMEELRKVRRVAEKGSGTVTETLLVIDATTGQNGLSQARQFTEAVDVTGVILTKLDGSAKGGIVVAIHSELGIPVKLAGLGEGIGDLVDFDPVEFVDALFE